MKKIRQYIKYDIVKCAILNYKKYILLFVILNFICFTFFKYTDKANFIDYIFYLDRGSLITNQKSLRDLIVPYEWLIINLFMLYIINSYNNIEPLNIIVQYSSKLKWLISKYVFCFLNVLFVYVIKIFVPFLFCIFTCSEISLKPTENTMLFLQSFNENLNIRDLFINVCILPFFSLLVMSFIQITIFLLFNNKISFISSISIFCASIFTEKPYLIGNFMMLQRNSMITGSITEEYVKSNCAFIILFFILIISMLLGLVYIKQIDIGGRKTSGYYFK